MEFKVHNKELRPKLKCTKLDIVDIFFFFFFSEEQIEGSVSIGTDVLM